MFKRKEIFYKVFTIMKFEETFINIHCLFLNIYCNLLYVNHGLSFGIKKIRH